MKWISVEERLPEEKTLVLATTILETEHLTHYPYKRIFIAYYAKNECFIMECGTDTVWFRIEGVGLPIYEKDYVTHWMPLPAPPEIEDNK